MKKNITYLILALIAIGCKTKYPSAMIIKNLSHE